MINFGFLGTALGYFKGIRWTRVLLIILPLAMGGAYLFGKQQGEHDCEMQAVGRLESALERQVERAKKREAQHRRELSILEDLGRNEERITRRIENLRLIRVSTPDCESLGADWVRAYSNGIRATGAAADP